MRFARRSGIALVAFFTVLATTMAVTLLPAATGDTIADHILGQGDFLHGSPNTVDGASLNTPNFIAVDRAGGHLYVSDTANNRVIGWSSITGFVNDEPADFVLGQRDLYGSLSNGNGGPNTNPINYDAPEGVAADSQGNLYVADTGNDRVLEYNAPINAGNNRVLKYDQPPAASATPTPTATATGPTPTATRTATASATRLHLRPPRHLRRRRQLRRARRPRPPRPQALPRRRQPRPRRQPRRRRSCR